MGKVMILCSRGMFCHLWPSSSRHSVSYSWPTVKVLRFNTWFIIFPFTKLWSIKCSKCADTSWQFGLIGTNLISKFSVKSSLSLGRNGINCSWVEVQAKVDSCCWIRLRKRIVCVHVDAFILWPDVHALGWLVSVPDSWLNSAPTRTSLRINDPQSWMHFWSNASHYSISWQLGV